MKKRVSVSYLYFLLPLLFFFLIAYSRQVDDIWFLFSHGRYVLNNGFPHTDFLTMHSGLHFVMQQWGFSVILYFFYHYFGSIGVLFFIGIINLLIIYFLYKICMIISSNNTYFSCLITCIIDLVLQLNFIIPRPQIITFLLLIITMYIFERYTKDRNDRGIYFLPLISLLLVNCHASMWFMFFIFCMPYLAEYLIHKDKRIIKVIIMIVISFLVGFINPYGTEAMFYALNSYGVPLINLLIREMHSFSLKGDHFLISNSSLILVIMITEIIFFIKNYKKYSIHSILFFLGLSFMSIVNLRNMSFLIFGTIPFIMYSISKKLKSTIPIYSLLIVFSIIPVLFIFQLSHSFYKIDDLERKEFVSYLNKNTNKKNVRIFTYFNDGPYLEYNGYKVYMDTRAEVFLKKNNHKEEIFNEYYKVLIGDINYDKFIDKYSFTHLLVHKDTNIYDYIKKNNNYKLVYHKKDLYLYERS